MRNLLTLALLMLLSMGCAVADKTYTSSGNLGYTINCSGTAMTWGDCYNKAGKLCGPKGYTVLEKNGDQGAMLSGNQFGLYAGSVINRSMVIE